MYLWTRSDGTQHKQYSCKQHVQTIKVLMDLSFQWCNTLIKWQTKTVIMGYNTDNSRFSKKSQCNRPQSPEYPSRCPYSTIMDNKTKPPWVQDDQMVISLEQPSDNRESHSSCSNLVIVSTFIGAECFLQWKCSTLPNSSIYYFVLLEVHTSSSNMPLKSRRKLV